MDRARTSTETLPATRRSSLPRDDSAGAEIMKKTELMEIRDRQSEVIMGSRMWADPDVERLFKIIEEKQAEFIRMENAWRANCETIQRRIMPLRECLDECLEQLKIFRTFYNDGFLGDMKDADIKNTRDELTKLILKIKNL